MAIEKGTLLRWIDDKGFGFIRPENGKNEIFIHISALKNMSRKPIVGDVIQYQISFDTNGKSRAVDAKIEGVSPVLTLTPFEKKRKSALSSPVKESSYRNYAARTSNPKQKSHLYPILLIIVVGIFIYSNFPKVNPIVEQIKAPKVEILPVVQTQQFQCQGKVWCSQMSSYEEAVFYLNNCPGTKMDGDYDGIPCENQF